MIFACIKTPLMFLNSVLLFSDAADGQEHALHWLDIERQSAAPLFYPDCEGDGFAAAWQC
jgi:hypothetical protein